MQASNPKGSTDAGTHGCVSDDGLGHGGGHATRGHSSPQIAVSPTTGTLAIVSSDVRTRKTCDLHLSVDDGASWFEGASPMLEPFTDCSGYAINGPYATIAYDREGTLLVALVANDPELSDLPRPDRPRSVFLARSTDDGRSFDTTIVYEAPEDVTDDPRTNNQRPMVVLDPNDPDNVYVSWLQRGVDTGHRALVAASTDGGRTFGEPAQLSDDDDHGGYQARVAVDHEGTVHAIFPSAGYADPRPDEPIVRPIFYTRSTDGGETWPEAIEIDEGNAEFSFNRKHELAADPDTGTLYAAWYGHPDARAERPDADSDLFVRVSTDGGDTWSDRVVVNDDEGGAMQYNAGIAVAPDGRVDLAWLDFRDSPMPEGEGAVGNDGGFNDVYYASSTDQGATWSDNLRVSDRSIDRRIGVWSNNMHSHTNVGIASTDDVVYLAWQDTRAGDADTQSEDIYFATVRRTGTDDESAGLLTGVPTWLVVGAALLLGMGLAAAAAGAMARRSGRAPAGA
ncbi:MAG: sialidase family protein [Egibacteraceae bacterium]